MPISPLAGKPPTPEMLINVDTLTRDYFDKKPDPANKLQQVSFGTSGHRGTPGDSSFNEAHILAIAQAICEYRASKGVNTLGSAALDQFDRLHAKVDAVDAEAELDEELAKLRHEDAKSVEVEKKLEELSKNKDLDDRLAALKAKMQKPDAKPDAKKDE